MNVEPIADEMGPAYIVDASGISNLLCGAQSDQQNVIFDSYIEHVLQLLEELVVT